MPSNDSPAVQINDVSYRYPPSGVDGVSHIALEDVNLTIEPKTRLGILGPNGGGKSTLIQLILGMLKPTTGSISVFGVSPTQARGDGLIGYLPQRIEAQRDWPINVEQVVGLGLACRRKPWHGLSEKDQRAIERAMDLLQITDLRNRNIGALSGGQIQRVMIARAIAGEPKLLVLDEPTVGVDIAGQQKFGALIDQLGEAMELTMIVVSHDMRAIAAVADRIACLSRTLHFHDAPEGLTPAVLAQVFAHDVAGVFGDVHIDAHLAKDCEVCKPSDLPKDCCGHDHYDHPGEGSGS
ncbi:MAG: metal ABC transporter ATP-binding protein [Phycisphaerales bacterium]